MGSFSKSSLVTRKQWLILNAFTYYGTNVNTERFNAKIYYAAQPLIDYVHVETFAVKKYLIALYLIETGEI